MQTAELKRYLSEIRPETSGVHFYDEVAAYITVADGPYHERPLELKASTVRGWVRRGFVQVANHEGDGGPKWVRFGDLVTCRMIAMLLSYGVLPAAIKKALDWLAEDAGYARPFIKLEFWTESPGIAQYLHGEHPVLFEVLSRRGRLPLLDSLDRRLHEACRMDFDGDTGLPLRWYPVDGVVIDPRYVSGNPILPRRRTATHYLHGACQTDDDLQPILDWYDITEAEYRTAVDWDTRLDEAGVLRWV